MAALMINIANLKQQIGDTKTVVLDSLYSRAFRIATQLCDTSQIIGMAYSRNTYLMRMQIYEEAMTYLKEAMALSKSAKLAIEEANLITQIGILLSKQGRIAEATAVLEGAALNYETAGNPIMAIYPPDELSNIYLLQGNYAKAIATGEKALYLKRDDLNFKFTFPRIYGNLAESYLKIGQPDKRSDKMLWIC